MGGARRELPWDLPPLSPGQQTAAVRLVAHWKRVHTLTETLYHGYRQLLIYMMTCQIPQREDTARVQAQRHIDALGVHADAFVRDLRRLPKAVHGAPSIAPLLHLPFCSDALLQSVIEPPHSDAFRDGLELVERIGQWLLKALRIADQILEQHFDKKARTS